MPGDGGRLVAIAVVILILLTRSRQRVKRQRLPEWISNKSSCRRLLPFNEWNMIE